MLDAQGLDVDRDGVHMLPQENIKEANALQEECREFMTKTGQFNSIVQDYISVVDVQAKNIEAEKKKAIGLRSRTESEAEVRKRKQREIKAQVMEKKAELERLKAQHDSLLKVEQNQKNLIERLSNNEA